MEPGGFFVSGDSVIEHFLGCEFYEFLFYPAEQILSLRISLIT
jgi:hypothetical protein